MRTRDPKVLGAVGAIAAAALVAGSAASAAAATKVVRPGPELAGWRLVAESSGDTQLNVNAGWVTAATAGRGSALLPATSGTTVGLHGDSYSGLLSAITSLKVTVKTTGTGDGPRVVLRTSTPCNYTFNIPASAAWTTYDLTASANNFWTIYGATADCPAVPGGTWSALKSAVGPGERIDTGKLDGVAGIRILTGDGTTAAFRTTYVDSFEFNGDVSNFEPPTVSLTGAKASIPAGGSIELPVAAVLSGPNQPSFGNSLGPITGNGGLAAKAAVTLKSSPAGLCTLTAATFSFAPESGLAVAKHRYSTSPALKIKTKVGAGGTCTLGLGSATNATASGTLTLTVTKTPGSSTPTGPVTTCVAKAVSKKSKIKLDMGPDLPGSANYTFRIDVHKQGAWFRYLKTMKTKGAKETRTVNVPKGTYRIKCYGPTEAQDSRSGIGTIKK